MYHLQSAGTWGNLRCQRLFITGYHVIVGVSVLGFSKCLQHELMCASLCQELWCMCFTWLVVALADMPRNFIEKAVQTLITHFYIKTLNLKWMWCCISVIPVFKRLRREDPGSAWIADSKNNKQTKQAYVCYYFPQSCILGLSRDAEQKCQDQLTM